VNGKLDDKNIRKKEIPDAKIFSYFFLALRFPAVGLHCLRAGGNKSETPPLTRISKRSKDKKYGCTYDDTAIAF
jgi:hypothetical protein